MEVRQDFAPLGTARSDDLPRKPKEMTGSHLLCQKLESLLGSMESQLLGF
jgi:hypothetical protein